MTLTNPIALFEKTREREASDHHVEVWEGSGYVMIKRNYPSGYRSIEVTPDRDVSRYLPHIYIRTDSNYHPTSVVIETTSYGSLDRENYKELMRAMALAEAHAEDIELHHLREW